MRITPGSDEEHKKIELDADESRQARTGHNVRYVLFYGLLGVVVCFVIILVAYTQLR